jgi:formate-nitrite transporter family protein
VARRFCRMVDRPDGLVAAFCRDCPRLGHYLITYVVGLGHFSHIIAGAVEVFALAASGEKSWLMVLGGYLAPTLAGNIIGGVTLVAALNHAQVVSGSEGQDI